MEKFKALLEANGTLEKIDIWGMRKFAYPINDMNEGYYVLMDLQRPRQISGGTSAYLQHHRTRYAFQ